jgi:hypothetical protein
MVPSAITQNPPIYPPGFDIEAFVKVIQVTLRRELGAPD